MSKTTALVRSLESTLAEAEGDLASKREKYAALVQAKAERHATGYPYASDADPAIEKARVDVELQEKVCGAYSSELARLKAERGLAWSTAFNAASFIFNLLMLIVAIASAYFAWKSGHP